MRGLNSVPMKVTMKYKDPPPTDEATLMAGIMGFEMHQNSSSGLPSLQPHHMWAMKLPLQSELRKAG